MPDASASGSEAFEAGEGLGELPLNIDRARLRQPDFGEERIVTERDGGFLCRGEPLHQATGLDIERHLCEPQPHADAATLIRFARWERIETFERLLIHSHCFGICVDLHRRRRCRFAQIQRAIPNLSAIGMIGESFRPDRAARQRAPQQPADG